MENSVITDGELQMKEQAQIMRIKKLAFGEKVKKRAKMEFTAGGMLKIQQLTSLVKNGVAHRSKMLLLVQAGVSNLCSLPVLQQNKFKRPFTKSPRRKQSTC